MASCICGRSYQPNYNPEAEDHLDLCPHCIQASTPQTYLGSKEFVNEGQSPQKESDNY